VPATQDFMKPELSPAALLRRCRLACSAGGAILVSVAFATAAEKDGVAKPAALIQLDTRFFEVSDEAASSPPFRKANDPDVPGGFPVPAFLLSATQAEEWEPKLQAPAKGVDLLGASRITLKSGEKGEVQMTREFWCPTEWEPKAPGRAWKPSAWEARKLGVSMGVEAVVGVNRVIDLTVTPEFARLQGCMDLDTKKTLLTMRPQGTPLERIQALPNLALLKDKHWQPIISTRKVQTSVAMRDGDTLIVRAHRNEGSAPGQARTGITWITAKVVPAPVDPR